MRPPRLLILILSFLAVPVLFTFISLVSTHSNDQYAHRSDGVSRIGSYFSFHPPSSLFPRSAIISLTDDNSTFFVARPAAFGPLLPSKGISGQLWIGKGFGDDGLRGGVVPTSQGELGCSDVPGWSEGDLTMLGHGATQGSSKDVKGSVQNSGTDPSKAGKIRRAESSTDGSAASTELEEDDGTDDYLHHPLRDTSISTPERSGLGSHDKSTNTKDEHADIESLQESAEIAGKVVLLTRGGCGFLEKVKWVQRRGGIAVIVGDNTRGGGLVTMYARGDTSNITIPSLFTSYTTAHLLSSLVPSGGYIVGGNILDGADNQSSERKEGGKISAGRKQGSRSKGPSVDGPTFTPSSPIPKATSTSASRKSAVKGSAGSGSRLDEDDMGWFRTMISWLGLGDGSTTSEVHSDSRRPPSSGHLAWVAVEDWDDEDEPENRIPTTFIKDEKSRLASSKGSANDQTGEDGFLIGVQDWRDPDLVSKGVDSTQHTATVKGSNKPKPTAGRAAPSSDESKQVEDNGKGSTRLAGGSITPGSGEYDKPGRKDSAAHLHPVSSSDAVHSDGKDSWLDHIPWVGNDEHKPEPPAKQDHNAPSQKGQKHGLGPVPDGMLRSDEHDGLWVTLTPTSVSTSPFMETATVLVVSPFITISVVYALWFLRHQVRKYRWRAPRSIVSRLPVRTYQTVPESSTTSLHFTSSPPSPTTPLLQSESHAMTARSRPRSRTASSVPVPGSVSPRMDIPDPLAQEHEKAAAAKKLKRARGPLRYTGRQVECCVCLEEYIDGVSRVMSLPCGHEFHAECITPWLTTRRRTCPICKSDVVRSVRSSSRNRLRRQNSRRGDEEDEDDDPQDDNVQRRVAESRNDSPGASGPIDLEDGEDDDLESAEHAALLGGRRTRRVWGSLQRLLGRSPPPDSETDRNR